MASGFKPQSLPPEMDSFFAPGCSCIRSKIWIFRKPVIFYSKPFHVQVGDVIFLQRDEVMILVLAKSGVMGLGLHLQLKATSRQGGHAYNQDPLHLAAEKVQDKSD